MTDAASSRSRGAKRRKRETSTPEPEPASSGRRPKSLPAEKLKEARRAAQELYRKRPDWMNFQRALYGVEGEIVKLFPTQAEREAFQTTREYAEIEAMIEDLRSQRAPGQEQEPIRIITVRIPRSVHEALRREASSHNISINKLCIKKLVKSIDSGE